MVNNILHPTITMRSNSGLFIHIVYNHKGFEIPDSDYEKLLTPIEIVNYLQKRAVDA